MKRIIFVGVHNKPGKYPLDSTTLSGKVIDKIIDKLDRECLKTNLFNIDRFPKKSEIDELLGEWYWTHLPTKEDIIVLLGKRVQAKFNMKDLRVISVRHPADFMNKNNYINDTIEALNK